MTAVVLRGDARRLPLADGTVDAVVTDPPYDLTAGKKGGSGVASLNLDSPYGRARIGTANGGGFMGKDWDATGVAFDPATWREALRVLKPGGHLLAFGGTRTWHRLACAVEDAGFEIRDSIHWIYGSGFPKSLDVSKAIDKAAGAARPVVAEGAPVKRMIPGADQNRTGSWIKDNGREYVPTTTAPATDQAARWAGWGTALKPAHEPIVVARKPLAGTVAANVLAHGTGALNIDACRVGSEPRVNAAAGNKPGGSSLMMSVAGMPEAEARDTIGRWPPNVILDPAAAAELDRQSGVTASPNGHGDSGGASRFFPIFRYQAKAAAAERPRGQDGTAHPTVKPVDLMAWLIRLVTPPGGLILDPFAGSGTTGEAAIVEGARAVLIELDPAYCQLVSRRLSKPIQAALTGT